MIPLVLVLIAKVIFLLQTAKYYHKKLNISTIIQKKESNSLAYISEMHYLYIIIEIYHTWKVCTTITTPPNSIGEFK